MPLSFIHSASVRSASLLLLYCTAIALSGTHLVAQSAPPEGPRVRIDTISIARNWRTKPIIILRELYFAVGDTVTIGQIDTAMKRIWNLGNFTTVSYQLDTLPDNRNHLMITARDALTIVPLLSPKGSRQDFALTLGASDQNFLGLNTKLDLRADVGTNANTYNVNLKLPRQLLYKNMTLEGGFRTGSAKNFLYLGRDTLYGVAYRQREVYFTLGHPNHQDYRYTVSPDLGLRWFVHSTDNGLIPSNIPHPTYAYSCIEMSLRESVGTVNQRRHQLQGGTFGVTLRAGKGLLAHTTSYLNCQINAEYNHLFHKYFQVSGKLQTAHTTSDLASLQFYRGATEVKGILTGQISGKHVYTAYLGAHVTYINREWFALEHYLYLNVGYGGETLGQLFQHQPFYAIGNGVKFMMPTVPWIYLYLYATYNPASNNWFYMEF